MCMTLYTRCSLDRACHTCAHTAPGDLVKTRSWFSGSGVRPEVLLSCCQGCLCCWSRNTWMMYGSYLGGALSPTRKQVCKQLAAIKIKVQLYDRAFLIVEITFNNFRVCDIFQMLFSFCRYYLIIVLSHYITSNSSAIRMDFSLPGSSVHEIPQARIVEWVAIYFSRGSCCTQGWNPCFLHCRQILYHWATSTSYYLFNLTQIL